jgi:hypothetical protein
MARFNESIEPMTLGNVRANGVRSLAVSCWQCHHRAILSADSWADEVPVPTFGPRMVCTSCRIIGAVSGALKPSVSDAVAHGPVCGLRTAPAAPALLSQKAVARCASTVPA